MRLIAKQRATSKYCLFRIAWAVADPALEARMSTITAQFRQAHGQPGDFVIRCGRSKIMSGFRRRRRTEINPPLTIVDGGSTHIAHQVMAASQFMIDVPRQHQARGGDVGMPYFPLPHKHGCPTPVTPRSYQDALGTDLMARPCRIQVSDRETFEMVAASGVMVNFQFFGVLNARPGFTRRAAGAQDLDEIWKSRRSGAVSFDFVDPTAPADKHLSAGLHVKSKPANARYGETAYDNVFDGMGGP